MVDDPRARESFWHAHNAHAPRRSVMDTVGVQMTPAFDLGPVPKRITVETEQVRRLVSEQLPQWADLPVRPVSDGGWDNWTFHLGTDMVVRMPSAAEYAEAVDKERRWLPTLASHLPLPVPVALAHGVPGAGYPFDWSVYQWLEGQTFSVAPPADLIEFAVDLADFVVALRAVDTAEGPQPGLHNWFRGGPLQTYDGLTRGALAELDGHLDVRSAAELWDAVLTTPWDGTVYWFHGDLAPGNLLMREGRLASVIDFGTCGIGDPACDLAAAWTLLTRDARQVFRDRLAVDDATWERSRGWALWKTLSTCSYTYDDVAEAEDFAHARRVLNGILGDAI
ncbi:MAG: aminoglycoside phosphotransferase family protein [Nocardioides sp.]